MPPRPPLRVLQLITRLIVGGAQEHALATALGQKRTPGMQVTLACGPTDGPEGDLLGAARAGVQPARSRALHVAA